MSRLTKVKTPYVACQRAGTFDVCRSSDGWVDLDPSATHGLGPCVRINAGDVVKVGLAILGLELNDVRLLVKAVEQVSTEFSIADNVYALDDDAVDWALKQLHPELFAVYRRVSALVKAQAEQNMDAEDDRLRDWADAQKQERLTTLDREDEQ
jgi:hypothetical protein